MKCKECGGLIVKVPTYTTAENTYEYVCNECGLVYSEPFSPEMEKFIEAEVEAETRKENVLKCRVCGRGVNYKGRGRKPKYCNVCAKHINCIQTAERMQKLRKNKLSKNDIYLLAIQKRAS